MDSPNTKGYGFRPTNEDIIDYLKEKRLDPDFSVHAITELDIYKFEPWELPGFSATPSKKEVRYFYCQPRYKYANSKREHRKTNTGYWKRSGNVLDMKADSGEVIGTKRYVPFYAYKKAKTKWVMHEICVKDDALYKKEFVICRIERKWNKKLGISNSDEGESSKQVVSPTQVLLPGDHSISNGNHIDENTVTDPQLPPPNDNVISSYPGNHIEQTSFSSHKPLPNHIMVSDPGNRIEQITFSNTQLLPHYTMLPFPENHLGQNTLPNLQLSPPNHNMNSYPGNHILKNTLSNPQLLPLNHNLISNPGNHILHNTISNPPLLPNHNLISCCGNHIEQTTNIQLVPYPNLTSYSRNQIKENTLTNPQGLSNYNMISFPWNHIEDKTSTGLQLPPYSVSQLVSKNTSQEEKHQLEEFNVSGGYNGLNYASFSTPQSLNYQEMELLQLPPNSMSQLVSKNTSQEEENHQLEEFTASSGYNRLNNASFSTPQSLNYQEMELSQLPPNSMSQLVSKNTSQEEENHQLEEFTASSGYNRLNNASFSTPQSLNYQEMELLQLPPNSMSQLVAKNTSQEEENHQLEEFTASSGYNRLNNASFSTPQSLNYQEMELLQLPPNSMSQLVAKNTSQEEENHQLEEFTASSGYNRLNNAFFSTPQLLNYQEIELLQLPPNSMSQLVAKNTSQEEENHQLEEFTASSGYNRLNNASFSTPQSLNYQEMELSQLPPNSMSQLVSKNTSQEEENHQFEEFTASSGYNRLNYASFSTPPSPNYQEMELSYSNSSIDNCDFLNFQFDSEQVIDLINSPRAFLDENSLEETGQTHTPVALTH